MPSRFERFSENARRVLSLAQEEAQRFNHNYIGTEHLLLGLLRQPESPAAHMLHNLGVEPMKARSAVEFIIGRGERPTPEGIGLTPRARKVIELAVNESRNLNTHYVGTEHLLVGIVREGEGVAAGVLESLGVTLDQVRAEMSRIGPDYSAGGPTPSTGGSPGAESESRPRRGPRTESGPAPDTNEGDASDDPTRDPTPDEIRRVLRWQARHRGRSMATYSSARSSWSAIGRREPWWRRLMRRLRRG